MLMKVCNLSKFMRTQTTLKWLLSSMDAQVVSKVTEFKKHLFAAFDVALIAWVVPVCLGVDLLVCFNQIFILSAIYSQFSSLNYRSFILIYLISSASSWLIQLLLLLFVLKIFIRNEKCLIFDTNIKFGIWRASLIFAAWTSWFCTCRKSQIGWYFVRQLSMISSFFFYLNMLFFGVVWRLEINRHYQSLLFKRLFAIKRTWRRKRWLLLDASWISTFSLLCHMN